MLRANHGARCALEASQNDPLVDHLSIKVEAVFMGQFGLLLMVQDSAYRLMGFKENAREVAANMPGHMAKESY